MVTESIDKIKLPDQTYLGYWQNATVELPFVDCDMCFVVFDECDERTLSWIIIANGDAIVRPVSLMPLTK